MAGDGACGGGFGDSGVDFFENAVGMPLLNLQLCFTIWRRHGPGAKICSLFLCCFGG